MFPIDAHLQGRGGDASSGRCGKSKQLVNLLLDGKCTPESAAKCMPSKMAARGTMLACPVGFEQKLHLESMKVFYTDHVSRSTAWNDPRKEDDNKAAAAADWAAQEGSSASEAEAELQLLCSAVLPEQARH